ncbi:hypothetical protein ACFE04_028783 [Oxalis oulophora]
MEALMQTTKIPVIDGGHTIQRSDFAPNSSSSVAMIKRSTKVKKLRVKAQAMDCGFVDKGSLLYYYGGDCGSTKDKKDMIKKQLKTLSKMDSIKLPITSDFTQSQVNTIKEAMEILEKQLKQVKAEEKESKKQRKAEKKAMRMKNNGCKSSSSSSSSCSSESSDSECEKVIDTARSRTEAATGTLTLEKELPAILDAVTTLALPVSMTKRVELTTKENVVDSIAIKRIEVCMGNKCKKAGSEALLEEFTRVTGVDQATVVGCKCMGKCKEGPNVKVLNYSDDGFDQSVRKPPSSLYTGVGLQDAGVIVSNLCCFGDGKGLVLPPPLA